MGIRDRRQAASAFAGAVAVAGTGSLIGAIRACGVRLPIVAGAVVAGLAHAAWRRRRPGLSDDPQLDETAPFGLV